MANNEVRIIGGLWKGRKLRFAGTADLRPTLGRVRETLFNWLAAELTGARCLDLFAGSGALGFEALSRGAASVTFVERDRRATAMLKDNASRLGLTGEKATIVNTTAQRFLRTASDSQWDIIFFDPPFEDSTALTLLPLLRSRLTEQGLLYIERSRHEPLPDTDELYKHSRAGDCHFGLLPRAEQDQSAP